MLKQVILVRKDLHMGVGKIAAQVAHASMAAFLKDSQTIGDSLIVPLTEHNKGWIGGSFTKVCLGVKTEGELRALLESARLVGIPHGLITDNGRTVFNGVPTVTCGAIGPYDATVIDTITGHLTLL